MARKTRRHSNKKHGKKPHSRKQSGINTIPELRRAFEYIETYVDDKLKHESKDQVVKGLRKEWQNVFARELTKNSAEAFVENRMAESHEPHRTIRRRGGAALGGAPLDYTTRAGVALAPGQTPDTNGHLPVSGGTPSAYGSYTSYASQGFWNPEIGKQYDPVPGQSAWPMPGSMMGSNLVHKGGAQRSRRTRKATRGGNMGAMLTQAFSRPFPSGAPPTILQDMQDTWHGKMTGFSPDQVQRSPSYLLGSLYPRPVEI